MIYDGQERFSNAQAITSTAASTNLMDLGAARDLAPGAPVYCVSIVTTTMTDSSSNSSVAVTLESDDSASFGSATTVATLYTIPAISAAGTMKYVALPEMGTREQFIRLKYTPGNGNLSAGAFTSFLTSDPHKWIAYAKGYVITNPV